MSSYLNALKRSLFRSAVEEPKTQSTPVAPAELTEKWIYIHDESSSTCDDEVINLNDTTFNSESGFISEDKALEMAEEIRKTREQWLKKQQKLLANQRSASVSKSVRSNKLKAKSRPTRCGPSLSSEEGLPAGASQAPNSPAIQDPETEDQAHQSSSDEKVCGRGAKSVKSMGKVRSKRVKLQTKFRPYSVSVRAKTLNQPAAKGMC